MWSLDLFIDMAHIAIYRISVYGFFEYAWSRDCLHDINYFSPCEVVLVFSKASMFVWGIDVLVCTLDVVFWEFSVWAATEIYLVDISSDVCVVLDLTFTEDMKGIIGGGVINMGGGSIVVCFDIGFLRGLKKFPYQKINR